MPPKKRSRVSQAASPEPEPAQKTPTPGAASPDKSDDQLLNDPWTDEEETGLFKGLMRWKPTGVHKHFRLLALHAWLLENDYIDPRNAHTKPAGVWAKLNALYDLPSLDAREDARQLSPLRTSAEQQEQEQKEEDEDADVYSIAANKIQNDEFDLAGFGGNDGFEAMMWRARLQSSDSQADSESDAELPDLNMADDPPIPLVLPSYSIEPFEDATPSSKTTKGRGPNAKRGKKALTAARRSSRKTESVADREEQAAEDEPEEENEEESDDEEDRETGHSGDEEESQASEPGPRRGRAGKVIRGRGNARARGRGRGRAR